MLRGKDTEPGPDEFRGHGEGRKAGPWTGFPGAVYDDLAWIGAPRHRPQPIGVEARGGMGVRL